MTSKYFVAKVALALVIAAVSVAAYANHSWSNYHWARTGSSFTLQTLDSTADGGKNANWPALLATAAGQWSQSTKLDLNVVTYSNALKDRKRCTAVSGKIRVCNAAYGNNGWLGLASINITSAGHITQGAAKMNDSYSSYWVSDINEAPHVMCQEVGHLFGLGHTSENGTTQNTCMDYSNSPTSTAPNQHDYDQLVAIYSHLDSSNTYSTSTATSVTRGQSGMAGDVPLGNLVHRGHFHEVYVAPDGRGGLWVTHVRLAPGFEHLETQ
jgi:hypothetical protein